MSSGALSLGAPTRLPRDPLLRARDERIESLRAVVGKLAHDFNNFLVPQFGYLTLLKDEIPAESSASQYARNMEAAGRKSESYIESILLGMRPHRQYSPHEFSFDAMLNELLDQWTAEVQAGTVISVEREIEPFTLIGDEKQWRNALAQLLSNARYALATGGKLTVTLQHQTLPAAEVDRLGMGTDEVVRLVVRDNGFGMAREVAERAFEPFFTTRTQIKAAGLGLTIVHSVTRFHGGQVELQTGEDQGTTVTVWIPLHHARGTERLASVGGNLNAAERTRKKVLLIEDDPLMKEVLRTWLSKCHLDLQTAETGAEAVKLVARNPQQWAMAILEAELKGQGTQEIFANVREVIPHAQWVVLTSRDGSDFKNGENSPLIMKKPFSHRAFSEIVQKYAAGHDCA